MQNKRSNLLVFYSGWGHSWLGLHLCASLGGSGFCVQTNEDMIQCVVLENGLSSFLLLLLLFGTQQRDVDNDVLFCGLSFHLLLETYTLYTTGFSCLLLIHIKARRPQRLLLLSLHSFRHEDKTYFSILLYHVVFLETYET